MDSQEMASQELTMAQMMEENGDSAMEFGGNPVQDYTTSALLFASNSQSNDALRVAKKMEEYGDSLEKGSKSPSSVYHQAAAFYSRLTASGDLLRVERKLQKHGTGGDLEDRLKEELRRTQVQMEELKTGHQKDKDEIVKNASKSVVKGMLDVLDNFDIILKALKGADPKVIEGVELVQRQMYKTLEKEGLQRLEVKVGDEFDPAFHEGEGVLSTDQYADNAVVAVTKSGYMFKGQLLRPAKVVVNQLE